MGVVRGSRPYQGGKQLPSTLWQRRLGYNVVRDIRFIFYSSFIRSLYSSDIMLADLMKYYMFEAVNKQLLERIPYCLFISFLIYVTSYPMLRGVELAGLVPPAVLLFVVFTVTNEYVSRRINAPLGEFFGEMDTKKLATKLRSIYEGRNSILDDVEGAANRWTFLSAVVAGLSISAFLVLTLLMLVSYSEASFDVVVAALFIILLYLYYDVSKANLFGELQAESENSFRLDILEMYTYRNSALRLKVSSKIMFVWSRFIGPPIHVDVPKIAIESMLLYENAELTNTIKGLAERKEGKGVRLQHDDGSPLDGFFVRDKAERITVLVEDSPKKVFPYILDEDYKPGDDGNKKWTSLAIIEGGSNRTVGHVFIHMFKGVFVKRRVSKQRTRAEPSGRLVLHFLMIGERSYVEYIKNKLEILSAKFPVELLNAEYQPY